MISVAWLLLLASTLTEESAVNKTDKKLPTVPQPFYTIKNLTTFPTSSANLSVIDILVNDSYLKKTYFKRRLLNYDREEIVMTESDLIPPKNYKFGSKPINTRNLKVDYSTVHPALKPLIEAPFAIGSLPISVEKSSNTLIIGLGGSQINNFLHYKFPKMNLTVVEIEEPIMKIAKRYFGLVEDDHQKVLVMDGVEHLKRAAESGRKYDAVFIDACSTTYPLNRIILCPTTTFLNDNTIKNIKNVLKKQGSVIIKMLLFTRDVDKKSSEIAKLFTKLKMNCSVLEMQNRYNRVLICANKGVPKINLEKRNLLQNLAKVSKKIFS